MPSVISESERLRQPEAPKMQLECLELAGCTLDRYISADNSRPSFLEVCCKILSLFTVILQIFISFLYSYIIR